MLRVSMKPGETFAVLPRRSSHSTHPVNAIRWWLVSLATGLLVTSAGRPGAAEERLDFARDIRPLLASACWSCHGPDEQARSADLRLDQRATAIAARGAAPPAIVPGHPETSLLLQRLEDPDPDRRMPPPSTKRQLTADQRALLRRWIAQGAPYAQHWAFDPPRRPSLPDLQRPRLGRGPLDQFVLAALEEQGQQPAPEAPRDTLLRRLSLDLTGLPPTPEQRLDFLAEPGPDAFERLADRLLASPGYVERMTMQWLDAARFADTNGYNNDEERSMWPWRDWVLQAFRRQMPYDQFITEQLAGDLLPDASLAQQVATGFHRNHALTTEGGIIEEEYRVEYVADRVHTTSTVLLGLSLQCARCHDHKYDPFSQREYYQLFSFFNQLPHTSVGYARGGLADPVIKVPTEQQTSELADIARQLAATEADLKAREAASVEAAAEWEKGLTAADRQQSAGQGLQLQLTFDQRAGELLQDGVDPARQYPVRGPGRWVEGHAGEALNCDGQTFVECGSQGTFDSDRPFSLAAWIFPTSPEAGTVISKMDDARAYRGYDLILENGRLACHLIDHWPDNGLKVIARTPLSYSQWHHVLMTYDGSRQAAGVRLYVDGHACELEIATDQLRGTLLTDQPLHIGRRHASAPFRGRLDDVRVYGFALSADDAPRLVAGEPVHPLATILSLPAADRSAAQQRALGRYYFEMHDQPARQARQRLRELTQLRTDLEKSIPAVMIMRDLPQPRSTHVLRRGQYDQPGEQVTPGVPASLPKFAPDLPANRLGLARWLFDPQHPLTARVAVNRWWESYFGWGIVETLEDFGTTGAWPTHPALLDWLATELIASGWDTLAVQRQLVTSATYRQDARATAEQLQADPRNQRLSRGPRFRLSAETVRDNALAIAGLLVQRGGGPSVKPYQPDGLWEDVTVERRYKYQADAGAGLYRRSMYTFWKRTCPPPALSTFDAPSRETCTIRRARTNTPLQALVLLNDPTYVEAARSFAERLFRDEAAPMDDRQRLTQAFVLALSREPRPVEADILQQTLTQARTRFQAAPEAATQLLAVGRSPLATRQSPTELAAWTIVCDMLLNLDETITKP
ncbi:MAG: DUF1553 domain-containing protein [Pirellulales bacterium]